MLQYRGKSFLSSRSPFKSTRRAVDAETLSLKRTRNEARGHHLPKVPGLIPFEPTLGSCVLNDIR